MKERLDQVLVARGLAETRERAQALIRAGLVVVGEHRIDKPGQKIDAEAPIRLKGELCPYVSRGGLKLEGALARFGLTDLAGIVALDVGASTGGFTDCLLQHGAVHVWAVDTGRGQLHERLRQDPRVRLREQANARELTIEWVGGQPVGAAVVDVSFISLRLILPPLAAVLAPEGWVLALVKPQFEVGRGQVGKGGGWCATGLFAAACWRKSLASPGPAAGACWGCTGPSARPRRQPRVLPVARPGLGAAGPRASPDPVGD